jgi:hypothetical protein
LYLKKKLTVIDSLPIIYSIPSRYIACRYLRIHITNVVDPQGLASKTSGVKINEIYGEKSSTDLTTLPCAVAPVTSAYSPRSYLYVDKLTTVYICEESLNRESSECYMSMDSAPDVWQGLYIAKINLDILNSLK